MKKKDKKERLTRPLFSLAVAYLSISAFCALQVLVIGRWIDFKEIPAGTKVLVVFLWLAAAAALTLWSEHEIRDTYQKPIRDFSKAASRVAAGDFSVYLPPYHTAGKSNYLDDLCADFNKMVEALGSVETLKTDFFSNVSHEIKTPLAVIQSNAELLLREGLTDEEREKYTQAILQSTKRLSNLITNMLKLNKLEKQVIKPMPQVYDVCAQLCACALQFEDLWEKKEIEFVADMEDRALILADVDLLEMVWNNLLSNALKFTEPGGTVTLTQTSEADSICVTVADTGCGMTEETRRHIFDKFYQGDTSHATEGNGLGLALVKRILELSDGTIRVKSKSGEGSAFSVTLPVGNVKDLREGDAV